MTSVIAYRKRPVVIATMHYTGANVKDLVDWIGEELSSVRENILYIKTLEGEHIATPGDYIIQGIAGEYYPCKPEIFLKTYEQVR